MVDRFQNVISKNPSNGTEIFNKLTKLVIALRNTYANAPKMDISMNLNHYNTFIT